MFVNKTEQLIIGIKPVIIRWRHSSSIYSSQSYFLSYSISAVTCTISQNNLKRVYICCTYMTKYLLDSGVLWRLAWSLPCESICIKETSFYYAESVLFKVTWPCQSKLNHQHDMSSCDRWCWKGLSFGFGNLKYDSVCNHGETEWQWSQFWSLWHSGKDWIPMADWKFISNGLERKSVVHLSIIVSKSKELIVYYVAGGGGVFLNIFLLEKCTPKKTFLHCLGDVLKSFLVKIKTLRFIENIPLFWEFWKMYLHLRCNKRH